MSAPMYDATPGKTSIEAIGFTGRSSSPALYEAALQAFEQSADGVADQPAELLQPAVFAGVDDAADHIFAAGDLLVVFGGRRQGFPGLQVDELRADRGRADV